MSKGQEINRAMIRSFFELGKEQRDSLIKFLKYKERNMTNITNYSSDTTKGQIQDVIDKLEKCSSSVSVKRTKNGNLQYYPNYRCQLTKLCPTCRNIQLRRLFKGHTNYLKKKYSSQDYQLLHITFSGANNDDPGYYIKMMSLLDSIAYARKASLPKNEEARKQSKLWKSVNTLISKYEYTLSNKPTRGKSSKKLFYNHHIHSTMILPKVIDGQKLSQDEIEDLIKGWFWKISKHRFTKEDGSSYGIKFQCDIDFREISELSFGYLQNAEKDLDKHLFSTFQHCEKVFDFHLRYNGDKRLVRKQFCKGIVEDIKEGLYKGESMVDMETISTHQRDDFIDSESHKGFDLSDPMTSTNTEYHRHQRIMDLWGDFGASILAKEVNQQPKK